MSKLRLPGAGPVPRLDQEEPPAKPCATPSGLLLPTAYREQAEALRTRLRQTCAGCGQESCEDKDKTWVMGQFPGLEPFLAWLCPQCDARLLAASKQALSMGSVVYYPAKDGGKHEG